MVANIIAQCIQSQGRLIEIDISQSKFYFISGKTAIKPLPKHPQPLQIFHLFFLRHNRNRFIVRECCHDSTNSRLINSANSHTISHFPRHPRGRLSRLSKSPAGSCLGVPFGVRRINNAVNLINNLCCIPRFWKYSSPRITGPHIPVTRRTFAIEDMFTCFLITPKQSKWINPAYRIVIGILI